MVITTRWWWIRHAPVVNTRQELYGHKDLDCHLSDEDTLATLADWLPHDAVWVTSHLKRAIATASAVRDRMVSQKSTSFTPIIEPAFAEQHFGDWEGMSFEELRDSLGDSFKAFWKAPATVAAPAGESFVDVIKRVGEGVTRITTAHAGRNIISVAHSGSIRAALAHALRLEPDSALTFRIDNLSLTVIEHVQPTSVEPERGARTTWRVASVNTSRRNGATKPS